MMKILNIHGYGGSTQNSAYTTFTNMGYEVISPALDYDNRSPQDILSELKSIIDSNGVKLIVGTSLGGFFSAVLSVRTGLPVILLNPCLMPFYHLPELGYNGDVKPFMALFGELSGIDTDKVSCIIGSEDELISTHAFTKKLLENERFRIITGGKHSAFTLPLADYFSEIRPWFEI